MAEFTVTITGKKMKGKDGRPSRRKTWYAVADFGVQEDKKRKRVWSQGFETEAEAKSYRDYLLRTRPAAKTLANRRVTFAEFLQKWLAEVSADFQPSTYASYKRNLVHHVLPSIGHVRLSELDAERLHGLYGELRTSGRHDGSGGLSLRTVRYIHTIIHRVLRDAVRWHYVAVNPADGAMPATGKRTSRYEFRTWSADEVALFLASSRRHRGRGSHVGDRLYPAWVLLLTTGMRRGEVLGLRWADVDLDKAHLAVRQTLVDVPEGGRHVPMFSEPKTPESRRNIALDQATVQVLRGHKAKQEADRRAAGEGWQDHDLVFSTPKGAPLHPERFSREFARRVAAYGLPRLRLHDLRHTHATIALQQGFNLKIIQERLGHRNIGITGDVYAHVAPTMQVEAAETVAAQFMPAVGR